MKVRTKILTRLSAIGLTLAACSLPALAEDKAPAPAASNDVAVPTVSEFAIKGLTPAQWVAQKTVVTITQPVSARGTLAVSVDDKIELLSNLPESKWTLDPAKYLKGAKERQVTVKAKLYDGHGAVGECSFKVKLAGLAQ